MEKLESKHILGYLPHKLKAKIIDFECDYVGNEIDEIVGVNVVNYGQLLLWEEPNLASVE